MMATCQRNISQHCWAQHIVCVCPPCCDRLGVVGSSFKMVKFEPTHRNTVAKRTQHVAPNNIAICFVGMLRSFGRGLALTKCIVRLRELGLNSLSFVVLLVVIALQRIETEGFTIRAHFPKLRGTKLSFLRKFPQIRLSADEFPDFKFELKIPEIRQ